MKCKFCNEKIEKKWKFCPFCGETIRRMFKFKFPMLSPARGNLKNIEKMFESFGFPMQIRIHEGHQEPEMQKPQLKLIKRRERIVEESKEPETKIVNRPSGMEISVKLPGVKSRKDIIIKKFEESLEIRAYFDKKAYFKVIPIKTKFEIIEEEFDKNIINLRIKKQNLLITLSG